MKVPMNLIYSLIACAAFASGATWAEVSGAGSNKPRGLSEAETQVEPRHDPAPATPGADSHRTQDLYPVDEFEPRLISV